MCNHLRWICHGLCVGLESGSQQIRIVTNEPQGCDYIGEVTGSQGNFLTGAFTSNANLETGARNDMKNQANKIGANTVQLLDESRRTDGQYGRGQRQTAANQCDLHWSGLQMPPSLRRGTAPHRLPHLTPR